MAIAAAMRMGAEGIKVQVSGRLNGVEMARSECIKRSYPITHVRADIDYAIEEALTTYGLIGVKVWICKGEVYGKRSLTPIETIVVGTKRGANRGSNQRKK